MGTNTDSVDPVFFKKAAREYLRHAPLSLCIRELNRLFAIEWLRRQDDEERSPVLDVGCGDGFWWTVREHRGDVYGVDISEREVSLAQTHIKAELLDVAREVPFPGQKFREIIGNCSLEHIRDIDAALRNLRAAAADDARLVIFVPARDWALQGHTQGALLKHSPRIAMALSGAMNGFFQHWHLYDLKGWRSLLEGAGWKVKAAHGLGNPRSEQLFRLFLPSSLMSFLVKVGVGEYPNKLLRAAPDAALLPFERLLSWALEFPVVPAESPSVYEYMIVAECG